MGEQAKPREAVDLEALFCLIAASGTPSRHMFWFDAGRDAATGWSFLGLGEPVDRNEVLATTLGGDGAEPQLHPGDFVGWESYEAGAAMVGAPVDAPTEPSAWMRVTELVAHNHATGEFVVESGTSGVLRELMPLVGTPELLQDHHTIAVARVAPSAYAEQVEACRQEIELGNAYQLCLTTQFAVAEPRAASDTYRALRQLAPSHHGGFVRMGEHAIASATPEQFLSVAGGRVSTSPMKGTRPRSDDATEDRWLAADLVADPKERAENTMIVDLMRNDLNRVCEPGTVNADRWLEVESYRTVHQLVSTVSGTLRSGVTFGDLLSVTFPAGSMTGAPKLSAMTILHGLEQRARGIYSGCFGYVTQRGTVDLAMVIRTIVFNGQEASVSAGGGITWHSVAKNEVAEVATKAKAPLQAVGAVLPPEWAATLR